MNSYVLALSMIGLMGLAMAWLPWWTARKPISYAVICLGVGCILFGLPLEFPEPNPLMHPTFTVRLTELGVIISLMGTGLKINRPLSLKGWTIPFLLVSVTMVLSIALPALLSWWWLGLAPASAVLLGAALAPTDPVLAADVQVGPPSQSEEDEVRFALTAEAGLNDGMAFPFTWLAIALARYATDGAPWLWPWLYRDVLYRVVVGVLVGLFIGRLVAYVFFELAEKYADHVQDGFVAISTTLLVYGFCELVGAYGFLAVFAAGLAIRHFEREHVYERELHDFTDQMERLLIVILLLLFGGALFTGLLNELTWKAVLLGVGFLLIIRPISAWLATFGKGISRHERGVISFFGIKGIGSFFYLSFALQHAHFEHQELLWATVGFVVLTSVVMHGILAYPAMRYIDRQRHKM